MIENFYLYLTGRDAYLRNTRGFFWPRRIDEVGHWNWICSDPESLNFDVMSSSAGRRPRRLHVYMGSALCKFLVVEFPVGIKNEEYALVSRSQMIHQLGLEISEWEFTSQVVKADGKIITCAVRKAVVERIRDLAKKKRMTLASVKPFVAQLWNDCAKAKPNEDISSFSLIAVEADAFTTVSAAEGVVQSINCFFHRGDCNLVSREGSRLQLANGKDHAIRVALLTEYRSNIEHKREELIRNQEFWPNGRRPDFVDLLSLDDIESAS